MKQYKYSLDSTSKKFICPKCNKGTLVKYVENALGTHLSDLYGRCDRETSCGYHCSPVSEKVTVDNVIEVIEPSFHSGELLEKSFVLGVNNNFIKFLKTIFSEEEVKEIVLKYSISNSKRWDGAATFWQIDNCSRVHAGKILQYNPVTGKRVKDENGKGLIDWAHSVLKRNGTLKEFNLRQCLFGLHLIYETTVKTIALVESEKTAIIMSFKYEMLLPIKELTIIAFPDKSEYNDWLNKAKELNGFGFNIIVNHWLESTNYESGTDIADVFIIEKKKQK
jgi:hypothetical protein